MSDMHVLTGDGKTWRIVMHFAVPGGNNAAGVSWADALVNSGLGGTTVLPNGDGTGGTIVAAEKTAVENGTVFEHEADFRVESGGNSAGNIRASLREFYAAERAGVMAVLSTSLRYFGATESKA